MKGLIIDRQRRCRVCTKYLPITEFELSEKAKLSGLKSSCKKCESVIAENNKSWKETKEELKIKRQKKALITRNIKRLNFLLSRKKDISLEINRLTLELNQLI